MFPRQRGLVGTMLVLSRTGLSTTVMARVLIVVRTVGRLPNGMRSNFGSCGLKRPARSESLDVETAVRSCLR